MSHRTRGRVTAVHGATVVFQPTNSTYQLHLAAVGGRYDGPIDVPVDAVLRATARKVYTVPSGGLFVTPIVGPPRIVQGRVTDVAKTELAVQAVVTVNVTLSDAAGAIELANGAIADGSMVNVVLLPGMTFEQAIHEPALAK